MKNKIDWRNYLIELAVVFIGITAAFALNNWQQNRNNASLEKKYITSLTEDIAKDIEQLESLIAFYDSTGKVTQRLAFLIRKKTKKDSINLYSQSLSFVSEFVPQSITYESLKTSGQMELLTDFSLKKQIHDVYLNYETVQQVDTIYKDFNKMYVMPFFIKNIDFQSFDIAGSGALNHFEFSNIVNGAVIAISQKVTSYKLTLDKCKSLKQALDAFRE